MNSSGQLGERSAEVGDWTISIIGRFVALHDPGEFRTRLSFSIPQQLIGQKPVPAAGWLTIQTYGHPTASCLMHGCALIHQLCGWGYIRSQSVELISDSGFLSSGFVV